MIPPSPIAYQLKVIRSYEPFSGSRLAWMHMMASATTLTNASESAAAAKNMATLIEDISAKMASTNNAMN